MKKLTLTITIIFLIIMIGVLSYSIYLNINSKNEINDLETKIENTQLSTQNKEIIKENLEKEIEKLNEELKEKISEYDLWLEVKEKITN